MSHLQNIRKWGSSGYLDMRVFVEIPINRIMQEVKPDCCTDSWLSKQAFVSAQIGQVDKRRELLTESRKSMSFVRKLLDRFYWQMGFDRGYYR